jgi:biopolymer transport protein ExbB
VLKRDNTEETRSIWDVGKVRNTGLVEVPRLEEKLNLLATIAQLAPLLGLLGTVLGFMKTFQRMKEAGLNAHVGDLSDGIGQALICAAAGLAVAIAAHAAYNYLVSRVNSIVLDMERAATEIVNIVTGTPGPKAP